MKEYFSHDYSSREDEKIKRLLFAHNWNGYGLYWAIIEMLYQNNGYMLTEYERIAFDLRVEVEIIDSIINDFGLFKFKQNSFYSKSVLNRLEQRKIKSEKARRSASVRWGKANAKRTQSDSNAIKVNKSKVNKSKEEREYIEKEFLPIFERWLKYKKDKRQSYKNEDSIKAAYNKLYKLAEGNSELADKIVEQSLANNWDGLFELKDENKKDSTRILAL